MTYTQRYARMYKENVTYIHTGSEILFSHSKKKILLLVVV